MVVHKPSLMSMPFKSLSARMLSMFIAQFSLMLRLLAIAMTFTTDTFGCERHISLVSDLQTVPIPNGARLPVTVLSNVVVH